MKGEVGFVVLWWAGRRVRPVLRSCSMRFYMGDYGRFPAVPIHLITFSLAALFECSLLGSGRHCWRSLTLSI